MSKSKTPGQTVRFGQPFRTSVRHTSHSPVTAATSTEPRQWRPPALDSLGLPLASLPSSSELDPALPPPTSPSPPLLLAMFTGESPSFFFFFDTVFSARSQHFFDFDRELWKWGVFFWFVGCRRGWGVWRRWCLSTPPLPLPGSFRFSLLSRRAGVWFRKVSASSLRFDYLLLFAAQSKVAGSCECDKIAWLCAAMPG